MCLMLGKTDRKARSLVLAAFDLDGSTMLIDNPLNEAQTESYPVDGFGPCWVCPIETLENMRQSFFGDACPCVFYRDCRVGLIDCRAKGYLSIGRCVLDGIVQ